MVQAFLLKNRLVATYGYRKDRLKSRTAWPTAIPSRRRSHQFRRLAPLFADFDSECILGRTQTLGGVLHVTSWLSAFYILEQPEHAGHELYHAGRSGERDHRDYAEAPSGKTNDYGVKLSLLKNRLYVTATKFHTVSKNEFGFSGFNKTNLVNIWNALGNSGALDADRVGFRAAAGADHEPSAGLHAGCREPRV